MVCASAGLVASSCAIGARSPVNLRTPRPSRIRARRACPPAEGAEALDKSAPFMADANARTPFEFRDRAKPVAHTRAAIRDRATTVMVRIELRGYCRRRSLR